LSPFKMMVVIIYAEQNVFMINTQAHLNKLIKIQEDMVSADNETGHLSKYHQQVELC